MKLWVKSLITLGSLTLAGTATMGGIALYNSENPSSQGVEFKTPLTMDNSYPMIATATLKDLECHFVAPDDIPTNSIAKYDPIKDVVIVGSKEVSYDEYRSDYIAAHGQPPSLVVYFGSALFQNDYIDAVSPKDFAEYALWFVKSTPWSGDLASLTHFSLKRGIQKDGSTIILGQHSTKNKERSTIEFYPDAFFGSLPGYSEETGRGNNDDSLLMKLTNEAGDFLTKSDIEALLSKKDQIEAATNKPFRIRYIKPVGIIERDKKSQMGYEVYMDAYPNLIDEVLKKNPFFGRETTGLHVDKEGKLVDGKYLSFSPNSRIPFLSVLSVANPSFKSPGINWLKYVGAHEYGHHTTLQTGQDASEDGIYAGPVDSFGGYNPDNLWSKHMLDLYLKARSGSLEAHRTDVLGKATKGEYVKFVEKGTPEEWSSIFGVLNPTDNNINTAVDNPLRRASRIFSELPALAARKKVSLFDLYIENAWDNFSGSISPGFNGTAHVYDSAGKLVDASAAYFTEHMYDGKGTKIEFVTSNGTSVPKIQKWVSNGEIVEVIKDAHGVLTFKAPSSGTINDARETLVKNKDGTLLIPNNGTPAELLAAKTNITAFMQSLTHEYGINGWENSATKAKANPEILINGLYRNRPTAVKPSRMKYATDSFKNFVSLLFANNTDPAQHFLINVDPSSTLQQQFDALKDGFADSVFNYTMPGIPSYDVNKLPQLANPHGSVLTVGTQDYIVPPNKAFTSQRDQGALAKLYGAFFTKNLATSPLSLISNTDDHNLTYHNFGSKAKPDWAWGYGVPSKDGTTVTWTKTDSLSKIKFNEGLFNPVAGFMNTKVAKFVFNPSNSLSTKLKGWTQAGQEPKFSDVLTTFSLDPSNDFMFGYDGNTVVTNAALSKFFDLAKFKTDNQHLSDEKIQYILSAILMQSGFYLLKGGGDTIDNTLSTSFKAFLTGYDHSYHSTLPTPTETFHPGAFMMPYLSRVRDVSGFFTTFKQEITTYKTAQGLANPNKVKMWELFMYLGLERYNDGQNNSFDIAFDGTPGPSKDVLDTLKARTDDKFGAKFSDYTFSIPEAINRDVLQITYSPSKNELENTPSFVSKVSESGFGWEYYIDSSVTKKYAESKIDYDTWVDVASKLFDAHDPKQHTIGLAAVFESDRRKRNFHNRNSPNFIGLTMAKANGFFQDDFLRRKLGNEIYDKDGNSINDTSISIKDFDGSAVSDRARATWLYFLKTKGIGDHNISGVWRSKDRDASYMWGYLNTKTTTNYKDIKYLEFKDQSTGEKKYLPVHIGQNNLYYYENRIGNGKRKTLEDDGFTSWTSDFASMGGFRNSLLLSKHNFEVSFVDKDHKVVTGIDLGSRKHICENGKQFGQAPNYFEKKSGKVIFHVEDQFNS